MTWVDFDRAQVDDGVFFTPETLQPMLDEEDVLVADVGQLIVSRSSCIEDGFNPGFPL